MKEHRKDITSSDVLEMLVRAGLKPASELERLRSEGIQSDTISDAENTEQLNRKTRLRKQQVA